MATQVEIPACSVCDGGGCNACIRLEPESERTKIQTDRFGWVDEEALTALQEAEAGLIQRDSEIDRLREQIDTLLDLLTKAQKQNSSKVPN